MKLNRLIFGLILVVLCLSFVSADPVLTVPATESVQENQVLEFEITATLPDNGTNVLTSSRGDWEFTQRNQTAGIFSWRPGYDDAGVYEINFTAKDDNSTDTKTTIVTVSNVNRAPQITSSPEEDAIVYEDYVYDVEADDPDDDTLTYTLLEAPVGMEIDSNGRITWEPEGGSINANDVEVEVSDGVLTDIQSFSIDVLAMRIDELNVIINGDDDELDDGDSFDVEVGDSLEFELVVENLYSGDEDEEEIDIEDVEVNIEVIEWEDNDDEDWDSDRVDIGYDDEETITIDLGTVPEDIDDGTHEVIITIEGEDEEGHEHRIVWNLEMEVDKEREDIRISNLNLRQSTIGCDRTTTLEVRLTNSGTRDSDEIVLEVTNSELGVYHQEIDIDLDEGDSDTFNFPVNVMSDISSGTYPIRVYSYFDLDDFDDEDVSDAENIVLTVEECQTDDDDDQDDQDDQDDADQDDEDDDDVVVIGPDEPDDDIEPEPEDEFLTRQNLYIAGLVLANIAILLVIILLVARLVK